MTLGGQPSEPDRPVPGRGNVSAVGRCVPKPCLALLVATVTSLALASCGGDDGDEKAAGLSGARSESPRGFSRNFERLTGVSVQPMPGEQFGTRLQVAGEPDRYARYGVYSFVWTTDEKAREQLLGKGPADGNGIHWRRTGASFTASKAFGENLVMRWVGRRAKRVNPQYERLSRVVEAAVEGDSSSLPAGERPCRAAGLDPLKGKSGECSVKGIPVKFTDAGDTLSTPVLGVEVLGMESADVLRFRGLAPIRPNGRFVIVAYKVRNKSPYPMRFLHPQLWLGAKLLPENPDTAFLLPRSRDLPLPPGEEIEARAAFDVTGTEDPREGAMVLPAERDGRGDPSVDLAQGWVRLKEAESKLPKAPKGGDAPAQQEG